MAKLEEKIAKSNSHYPATCVVRNYLDSSTLYANRQVEYNTGSEYQISLQLFEKGSRPPRQLFSVSGAGKKNETLEECYKKMAKWIDKQFQTQGNDDLDVVLPEEPVETTKEENVIITGTEEGLVVLQKEYIEKLMNWSCTEKYYSFIDSTSGIMNRWFPLDSVQINTTDAPELNGGLKKIWKIPEDLFKDNLETINVLPVRGFLLGRFKLEFKLVVQANPFQACCIMLSTIPNPYGLINNFRNGTGLKNSEAGKIYPLGLETATYNSYLDYSVAVQRPNVIIDVSSGGEGTIEMVQKYHKTLVRNFDYSYVKSTNAGIRGSYTGGLALHVLSSLVVGAGNENNFNARVFYRFVDTHLTGMTPVVSQELATRLTKRVIKSADVIKVQRLMSSMGPTNRDEVYRQINSYFYTQGPVLSLAHGVRNTVDFADDLITVVEKPANKRKGFLNLNRDKPVDSVTNVRNNPRPRTNFQNGTGIDDSVVVGLDWNEVTQFFEKFTDEPKNVYDLIHIPTILDRFSWNKTASVSSSLFTWVVHPTLLTEFSRSSLGANNLRNLVGIMSSMYTNYCGTIELFFQFVKTQYHRGAVEVAIHFGRNIDNSGLRSTYVKILNIQECNGFTVTVPYIYDTPVRHLNGTSTPMFMPNITDNDVYGFSHSASINVTVLNQLVCPESVSGEIDVIVWVKGGKDFVLNFPRPPNTLTCPPNSQLEMLQNPINTRKIMVSEHPDSQHAYQVDNGSIRPIQSVYNAYVIGEPEFVTQGIDDFNQSENEGNRVTNVDHMDYKTILKMPTKILSEFTYVPTTSYSINAIPTTRKNYLCIPVAPLNFSLINYLNNQYFNLRSKVQDMKNVYVGNMPLVQNFSTQVHSMFSMYRGSICYTVVSQATAPVYVAYLPHDYQLRALFGPLSQAPISLFNTTGQLITIPNLTPGMVDDTDLDLAMSNLYNTMIINQVNATEKFVVPMSTQNNWILMNRSQAALEAPEEHSLRTMRENSEWFNGHLIIWSSVQTKISVYINNGDDFELGGFLGHPGFCNPYSAYALNDNWRVQGLDFKFKDITCRGWKSLVNLTQKTFLTTTLSIIGLNVADPMASCVGALVIYTTISGLKQVIELKRTLNEGCSEITSISDQVLSLVDNNSEGVHTQGTAQILQIVNQFFPFIQKGTEFARSMWTIAQHLIHSVMAQNWKNTSFSFFCIMLEMKLFKMEDWTTLKDTMMNLVSTILPGKFLTQGSESVWESFIDVIIAIVGTRLQIKGSGGVSWYFKQMFHWQSYKHISGLQSLMHLSKTVFKAITRIVEWGFERIDPSIALLKAFHNQDEQIELFLNEATLYLNNFNDADFKRKDMRVKFLHTILRAHKLRVVLIKIANPKMTSQLLQLCNKVIEKANNQRYLFKCDLVKTEPFVLCISGDPAIGKSFAVYDIAVQMLKSINYTTTNPDLIYTVPAGVQYWNGYLEQPCIWYDDWCNLTDEETMKSHLSQLYALKTSAPFNVPRAELENKEQIANPEILVMTTNNPFPRSSIVVSGEAIYRRRDLLVHFQLSGGRKSISEFTKEQLGNFEHIEVRIYKDPKDDSSLQAEVLTYHEFINQLTLQFKDFYSKELTNKEIKYNTLLKCMKTIDLDNVNLYNPFDMIQKINTNEDLMTSELLEQEVEKLIFLIKNYVVLGEHNVDNKELFNTQGEGKSNYVFVQKCKQKISDLKSKWNNMFIRCFSCGILAHVHGTTMWCEEGSHYMCFHCSLSLPMLSVPIEDEYGQVTEESKCGFQCAYHNCPMIIQQEDFITMFLTEFVERITLTPRSIISWATTYLAGITGRHTMVSTYILSLESAIYIWKALSNMVQQKVFTTQSNSFDFTVTNMNYVTNEKWLDRDDYESDNEQYRQMWDRNHQQIEIFENEYTPASVYICPHSLLLFNYTYSNGWFYPEMPTPNPLDLGVPDLLCNKRCCLTNERFLKYVSQNLMCTTQLCDTISHFNIDEDGFDVPRFLQPVYNPVLSHIKEKVNNELKKDWWDGYISRKAPWFVKLVKTVTPLLIGCAVFWGASKIINVFWQWVSHFLGLSIESQDDSSNYSVKTRNRNRVNTKQRRNNVNRAQAITDNFQNKLNKISNNYILISAGTNRMIGWGVSGSTFLIPKHLSKAVKRVNEIEIEFVGRIHEKIKVFSDNLVIVDIESKDLSKITILHGKILFKDCTGFLPPKIEDNTLPKKGTLVEVNLQDGELEDVEVDILSIVTNTNAMNDRGENFTNDVGVMYDYEKKGICGSLLCADIRYPIISLHIAGSDNLSRGIGVLLTQMDFETQGLIDFEDTEEETRFYGDDIVISYQAALPTDLQTFIPRNTKIQPSLIADVLEEECVTQPAILSQDDPRYTHSESPLYYGVQKNGRMNIDFPKLLLDQVYAALLPRMLSGIPPRRPSVLTFDESILGFPNVYVDDLYSEDDEMGMYYGTIPLDTSSGWPYTTQRIKNEHGVSTNKKSAWISYEFNNSMPIRCLVKDKIIQDHEANMRQRKRGQVALNVFQDCLKDERRKTNKVLSQGGTRLFSMSNIEGTIALRKYTLDLTSHLRYNRLKNYFSIGINPESEEWTVLAIMLKTKGNNIFTTDFTNFGAGLNYYCGMYFYKLIIDFYKLNKINIDRETELVIEVLIRELMGSYHVAGNLLYKTYGGSPSGSAVTAELNSFVHIMYVAVVWRIIGEVIAKVRGMSRLYWNNLNIEYLELEKYIMDNVNVHKDVDMSMEKFLSEVIMCVYGDDGIFSVTDEYKEIFNAKTINLVLKEHKIGVTDAFKKENIVPYHPLEEAQFLKRSFVINELLPTFLYAAKMDINTVTECVRWVRRNEIIGIEESTRINALMSLQLIWGHGEIPFNEWKIKINEKLQEKGIMPIAETWIDVARKFYPKLSVLN